MMTEFTIVLKKMKDFFQHDKIQTIIQEELPPPFRKHSRTVTNIPSFAPKQVKKDKRKSIDIAKEIKTEERKTVVPKINLGFKINSKEILKKKYSENKLDHLGEAKNLITSFSKITEDIVKNNEITKQQLSFRQRLDLKKQSVKNMVFCK
jgi:hypothetical protein